jgi:hypothetical protein
MQAVEAATAPTSEDDKLGGFGLVDQPAGRDIADESPAHLHVGVDFLPAGEPFAEHLLPFVAVVPPIHAQDGKDPDVAPGV